MKNKAKTDLNKMTKKSLLLHIENMKLNLENDHLETQKSNREMQDILAKYKDGTNWMPYEMQPVGFDMT